MRFDPDANPTPDPPRQAWIPLITGLILLTAAGMVGWALIQESRTPPSLSALPATPPAAERPPVELMSIASSLATLAASPHPSEMVMVTHTPEPPPSPLPTNTPDPSIPTRVPTPNRDAGTCPVDPSVLPTGSFCKWAQPTKTPLPTCLTPIPGDKCEVR